MSTITDVYCVSVPVSDQEGALAFFVDKCGFEIRRDAPMGDGRWVTVAARGGSVEVALQADADSVGSDTGIRFATHDAGGAHEHLARLGVEVKELLRWPGVPLMFQFADPDGNIYTVIETA